jgi:hypothetical protein
LKFLSRKKEIERKKERRGATNKYKNKSERKQKSVFFKKK